MLKNETEDMIPEVAQAIRRMSEEQGHDMSPDELNLSELSRRTGISRGRLRRLKKTGFVQKKHGRNGAKASSTVLTGYTEILDDLLKSGVKNSVVCLNKLRRSGYQGGQTAVKEYIASHQQLVPSKRRVAAPQGSRGMRFRTEPGEAFQMDWGFAKVLSYNGIEHAAACFVMICHHCGQRYAEFFPNAKQENLFIGMLHAFRYMGVPQYVLTDNMKSIVVKRDGDGHPVWQKDYEAFMGTVGFRTKLCKPRHPFTKGKVERLVRFVKENFLVGRTFVDLSDLNAAALEWCNEQNGIYNKTLDGISKNKHMSACAGKLNVLPEDAALLAYLCPERRISFDGFVHYEGRRFGVPASYAGKFARVMRRSDTIYIYSPDMRLLTTHDVTWSRKDSFCDGQYALPDQPEEFPTMPVKSEIRQLQPPSRSLSFDKFNFDTEDGDDD